MNRPKRPAVDVDRDFNITITGDGGYIEHTITIDPSYVEGLIAQLQEAKLGADICHKVRMSNTIPVVPEPEPPDPELKTVIDSEPPFQPIEVSQ